MPWPCFKILSIRKGDWEESAGGGRIRNVFYTLPDGREVTYRNVPPGAMWHSDMAPFHCGEPSICVMLPGHVVWNMNQPGTNGHMWQVSGEIPNVTAHPSINYVGLYHGWVQNGVVSDDVDGRKFDEMGNRLGETP